MSGELGGMQGDMVQCICNQVSEVVFRVFFSYHWF